MFRSCCRRRAEALPRAAAQNELDEWLLIDDVTAEQPRNVKFVASVKKIKTLLIVRRLWAQVSSSLNTGHVRRNTRLRSILGLVRVDLQKRINGTKGMFEHLERKKGVLSYRRQ